MRDAFGVERPDLVSKMQVPNVAAIRGARAGARAASDYHARVASLARGERSVPAVQPRGWTDRGLVKYETGKKPPKPTLKEWRATAARISAKPA